MKCICIYIYIYKLATVVVEAHWLSGQSVHQWS